MAAVKPRTGATRIGGPRGIGGRRRSRGGAEAVVIDEAVHVAVGEGAAVHHGGLEVGPLGVLSLPLVGVLVAA